MYHRLIICICGKICRKVVKSRGFTLIELLVVTPQKFLRNLTGQVAINKKKGFTLIELLVVIAIIGLLASIVLVSLNSARAKARDTKRLADIKQIQSALEMYYNANNAYPISGNCGASSPNGGWCNSVQSMSGGHWIRNGSSNLGSYLAADPTDPNQGSSPNWAPLDGKTYFYYSNSYGGSGQWYMIVFGLENRSHAFQSQDGVTACDGTYFHYGSGSNGIITIGANCAK